MKKIYLSIITVLTSQSINLAQDRMAGKPWAGRSEVIAQNGMVCTSHPLSTQVGIEILKAGGSAIDAAWRALRYRWTGPVENV